MTKKARLRTTSHMYGTRLPNSVLEKYQGAGVIPFARDGDNAFFLLGSKTSDKLDRIHWTHFHEKRIWENDPSVEATALRALTEGSGDLLEPYLKTISKQFSFENTPKLWVAEHNAVVFMVTIPYDPDLPKKFQDLRAQGNEFSREELMWFNVSLIHQLDRNWWNYLIIDDMEYYFAPRFCDALAVPRFHQVMFYLPWRVNLNQLGLGKIKYITGLVKKEKYVSFRDIGLSKEERKIERKKRKRLRRLQRKEEKEKRKELGIETAAERKRRLAEEAKKAKEAAKEAKRKAEEEERLKIKIKLEEIEQNFKKEKKRRRLNESNE